MSNDKNPLINTNKIVVIAHDDKFIKHFLLPHIEILKQIGLNVTIVTNNVYNSLENIGDDITKEYISIQQSPFSVIKNMKGFIQLMRLFKKEKYDVVYAHTPVGGIFGRMIKLFFPATKVIYLPHGYHFYEKSGLKSWWLFYPVEKILSFLTNCTITINEDDYILTTTKLNKKIQTFLINGVGVDISNQNLIANKHDNQGPFIITHVAELNDNKNQITLLNAVREIVSSARYSELKRKLKVYIIGEGKNYNFYQDYIVKNKLDSIVEMTGYTNEVDTYLKISDCAVSCSKREGLPINLIESLSFGVPIVATDCRGNRDIVEHGINGFIFEFGDYLTLANHLMDLMEMERSEYLEIVKNNYLKSKQYSMESVSVDLIKIFDEVIYSSEKFNNERGLK